MMESPDFGRVSLDSEFTLFTVSDRWLGSISRDEIFEKIGSDAEFDDCISIFSARYKAALQLCYSAQSIRRCCILLKKFEVSKNLAEASLQIRNALTTIDFSFLSESTFRIDCERIGSQDYHSVDIAAEIAKVIQSNVKCSVDFKNPRYVLYAFVRENSCLLGVDLAGFDLSRRDYKIFNHPGALKGTIAYAIFRSGLEACAKTEKLSVLNAFCKSGELAIEAALFLSRTSPNFFRKDSLAFWRYFGIERVELQKAIEAVDSQVDSSADFEIFASDPEMRHLSMARKNARIAGVERFISFSRNDPDWLDIKFGQASLDLIISDLNLGKRLDSTSILRLFLKQADLILEEEGSICVSFKNFELLKSLSAGFNLGVVQHLSCAQGQQQVDFYVLKRSYA